MKPLTAPSYRYAKIKSSERWPPITVKSLSALKDGNSLRSPYAFFWCLGISSNGFLLLHLHISCKKAGSLEEQQTAAPDRLLGATRAYVVIGHNVGAARKTVPRTAESCPRQADIQGRLMLRDLLILEGRPEGVREIRIYF